MSVFTEYLQQLAGYSEKVDTGAFTHDDFIEYQRIEPRIVKAYKDGRFHDREYRALIAVYQYVKEGARIILGLD